MRNLPVLAWLLLICLPSSIGAEDEDSASSVALGGGVFGRYLHLDLRSWDDGWGNRLPAQDLFYYGGRILASGPVSGSPLRWRLGGETGLAGSSTDDVNELNLGLITAGVNSGLTWRPGRFGISLDMTVGGGVISTEIKRAELEGEWDLYEMRDVGVFYWEPLLSLDWEAVENFVVRLQAGYSFLYGRGKEVGGVTGGLACDLGRWM